jgi:hypothetical protein
MGKYMNRFVECLGPEIQEDSLTANAKDVEQGRKLRLGVILIQAAGFVQRWA